jgi:hypothetical protein
MFNDAKDHAQTRVKPDEKEVKWTNHTSRL